MKLSAVKGERTIEVIAEIIDPIANIAEDEKASAMFKREKLPKGMDAKSFLTKRIRKSLPTLLRNHKSDIIAILSSIEGTSPEEYSSVLSLAKLIKDIIELLTDEAFAQLFISAQNENSSGSAQESIKGREQ